MNQQHARHVLTAAGLLLAANAHAQFFNPSHERMLIAFRNSTDTINVGFDIGAFSDYEATDAAHALPGVTQAALAGVFGNDLSDLRWSVGGFDQHPGIPAKTTLWVTTPSAANLITYGGGQNNTRTAMDTAINNFGQGVALGSNGYRLNKADETAAVWNGSYSTQMGAAGKWNATTSFVAETTTGADFNDPGDSVAMALWSLSGTASSGAAGTKLGSIVLSLDGNGQLLANFQPVPEPASLAVAGMFGLGAIGLVVRRRLARGQA